MNAETDRRAWEGHSIIANETTLELCQRFGCGH
jgi:hypothetical protein